MSSMLSIIAGVLNATAVEFQLSGLSTPAATAARRLQTVSDPTYGPLVSSESISSADALANSILSSLVTDQSPTTSAGDGLSVTVAVVSSSTLSTSTTSSTLSNILSFSSTFGPRLLSATNDTSIALRRLQWSVNPYSFAVSSQYVSTGVVTVDVLDSTGAAIHLPADTAPSTLQLFNADTGSDTTAVSTLQCSYFDLSSEEWLQDGVILIGYDSTTLNPICGTLHLTDFAGVQLPAFSSAEVGTSVALRMRYGVWMWCGGGNGSQQGMSWLRDLDAHGCCTRLPCIDQ